MWTRENADSLPIKSPTSSRVGILVVGPVGLEPTPHGF
jgi:hypothetical protein